MHVVSIGEILWDVIGGREFLGGAPFNLCAHLARLGHAPYFVSAVGRDERGRSAKDQAAAMGVTTECILETALAPTGVSEVVLDGNGVATHKLLRPAAYDFMALDSGRRVDLQSKQPKWICFGTLAQTEPGPRELTHSLLRDNPNAGRFYDVNLRPGCWTPELVAMLMQEATAAKLNEEELWTLANVFDCRRSSLEELCGAFAQRFAIDLVCITRGECGCALWRKGEFTERAGVRVAVADTVGAGDAFSAALLHGLDRGWPLAQVAEFANRVGALVASRPGATPAWHEAEAWALGTRTT